MYILCIGAYEKKKGEKRDCYLIGRNKYISNFNIFLKDWVFKKKNASVGHGFYHIKNSLYALQISGTNILDILKEKFDNSLFFPFVLHAFH